MVAVLLALALAGAGGQPLAPSAKPVQISGRLITPDGRPLRSADIVIRALQAQPRPAGGARIEPDGHFTFENVPPGDYIIRARGVSESGDTALVATFRVSAEGRDIRDLELMMAPGGVIEGRVTVRARHGHTPPALTSLRIATLLEDGTDFGTASRPVGHNGRFRLSGVIPGTHVLVIEGLPFPWQIARARPAGLGIAANSFLVERNQQFRDVEVVLSDTAARVTGTVSSSKDPGAGCTVAAIPIDASRRQVPVRFVRSALVQPDGRYELSDLVPGEYALVAIAGLDQAVLMKPDVLERLAGQDTRIAVAEGQVARVALETCHAAPRP